MFEKFGEMSSCREINELAENLLNEGDIQSLKVMAQENGIPEDYPWTGQYRSASGIYAGTGARTRYPEETRRFCTGDP